MVKYIGCVPLRCRHGRVTYLAQYLHLYQVRLLETKVFSHHRIRFTFLPDQRLHFCHLLPSSSTRFVKKHAPAWLKVSILLSWCLNTSEFIDRSTKQVVIGVEGVLRHQRVEVVLRLQGSRSAVLAGRLGPGSGLVVWDETEKQGLAEVS